MFKDFFNRTYNWISLFVLYLIPDNEIVLDVLQLLIALLTVLKLSTDLITWINKRKIK